jgi:PAS domain-containing protein
MTQTIDPVPYWSRQLSQLRTRTVKRGRQEPIEELTEAALSACDALLRDLAGVQLEYERLRAELRAAVSASESLFEMMPIACVMTDEDGVIVEANREAGQLLNVSAKRLKDRDFIVFCEERRPLEGLLRLLAQGTSEALEATLLFRPRECRPSKLNLRVVRHPQGSYLWFLAPESSCTVDVCP